MALTFFSGGAGRGISSGLGRGLVASDRGVDITGEGMGIGAVAVRTGGYTYFAGATGVRKAKGRVIMTFLINKRMVWTFLGRKSLFITRLAEKSTQLYMSGALAQKTLMHVRVLAFIKKIMGFGVGFEESRPVAEAKCEFRPGAAGIRVRCGIKMLNKAPAAVYLMNEFSADYFDSAVLNGGKTGLPSGWEKLQPGGKMPWLRWASGGVDFSLANPAVKQGLPLGIFWGREKAAGISWAGFELETFLKGAGKAELSYDLILAGKGAHA